jgi:hypothetical protein
MNKKGGLNNIVEKALGSVAKSGTSAIAGVLAPGERVIRPFSRTRSPGASTPAMALVPDFATEPSAFSTMSAAPCSSPPALPCRSSRPAAARPTASPRPR